MNKRRNFSFLAVLAVFLALPAWGQNRTSFAGITNAIDFDFGYGTVPAMTITAAPGATGAGTITVLNAYIALSDGTVVCPLNVNAPLLVGNGTNQETVTPTAVSCGTPNGNNATITATFANLHGSDSVASGTFGAQEAVNYRNARGGGYVSVSDGFVAAGGSLSTLTGLTPYSSVNIMNNAGTAITASPYLSMQPTSGVNGVLATPATLTSSTVVFTATPVGTWANSAYYFCVTYVDAMGGESPCSATYTQTPTLDYTLNITAPAASTGAVGWRAYAGTGSIATAYLLPTTATNCTLSTATWLSNTCAMGSNGQWTAVRLTTTVLKPNVLGVTNTNNPVPQSHTSFGYQPSNSPGYPFQTHYGPFGWSLSGSTYSAATVSSCTASDNCPLATVELPAAFLNYIGRTIRVTAKIQGADTATGTIGFALYANWGTGNNASSNPGLGVAICNPVSASALGTQTYSIALSCTIQTNAVGATAVGTVQPDSWFLAGGTAGTTNVLATEYNQTAVGSVGLFSQVQLTLIALPLTEAFTSAGVSQLDIEVVQ
jgi:hypothetical protein